MIPQGPPNNTEVLRVWDDQDVDEWLSLFASRNEVATAYAAALRLRTPSWPYWKAINAGIVRRWSPYALRYIKTRAWNIASEGGQR